MTMKLTMTLLKIDQDCTILSHLILTSKVRGYFRDDDCNILFSLQGAFKL